MIFVELRFFVFFAAVFAVSWGLRRHRAHKLWLLACSYAFYAAWDWRFLGLILGSTAIDYVLGLRLGTCTDPGRRRRLLTCSLVANLGILALFKYCNFFLGSGAALLGALGIPVHLPTLSIVLPVGISFYTFQTMSYTLDVYRGRMRPTSSVLDFSLFVAFFPQLVAGPIVRAQTFLPQLSRRPVFAETAFRRALLLFLVGYFKKACVSDNLAPLVDAYYAAPATFDALSAWIANICYGVQIYCDFSGYSDMAIACAAMLGYRLCVNFDYPYLARNISAFWRRWHISLSSWLKDYVYVSLGGDRGRTRLFTYRNLLLTMLLAGLWHGAAWTYVLWGGLHGLALVAHREWSRGTPGTGEPTRASRLLATCLTLYFVTLTWSLFRATGLAEGLAVAKACLLLSAPGTERLPWVALLYVGVLLAMHVIDRRVRLVTALGEMRPLRFAMANGALWAVAIALTPIGHRPFIYFQF